MIEDLLRNNLAWAATRTRLDPEYFRRLSAQQSPEYLWIGCSDSRVPANEVVGLQPGELFVHRNVANLAPAQDMNLLAVLQFALESLKVRHIIVCGHYGCGGVRAVLDGQRHGVLDHWMQRVQRLCEDHATDLEAIHDAETRVNFICEKNVLAQVRALSRNPFVTDAWRRGQVLSIHGWIYSIRDGLVRDLETTVSSPAEAASLTAPPALVPRTRRAKPPRPRPREVP
ncbi:MAG: carbonic anhydrase [Brevundimonas sp. 32-68-21]|jgi:carbonic anhydrase|uniref:Carbonic anhydrase n=1 Tax=Brevundimonas mediterranea TaxID=74329 RepID=A0A6G7EKE2_9CAUL|nr:MULTISPECIES: carbonic anhydrase [Brevundimonas]OGN47563.1 MAG: carbonic anhydrase [Caulobacterales bacterium RIFCSPHIGHO2_12_FULL_68_13]OGN50029.1 MAG: carbonic anhydrase [Caulobacterales bacterium RIFCSPHIGHO2_01_FULL_67_30]OYX81623.1 MAG: carbonic anhydrase [Brevundimonas sp. 32-68-21]PZO06624.1 MAG: carbonic anhydrase [Alphaproteobacteria bacterium]EDX78962.1 Carbonic anhydrase [Brevundimonas sp. BAL3]